MRTLFILLALFYTTLTFSQDYVENRYYEYPGQSITLCGDTYTLKIKCGDHFHLEDWRVCQTRIWKTQWRSGLITKWGPKGWYVEWDEGVFWYFENTYFNQRIR